ncbi:LOW QUALITY PROTEIN: hypothetical protein YC2023_100470 [Brassica napus]
MSGWVSAWISFVSWVRLRSKQQDHSVGVDILAGISFPENEHSERFKIAESLENNDHSSGPDLRFQELGGAWCNSIKGCQNRKTSRVGSSTLMDKHISFKGILSNKASENPAEIRYCDGASFSGDSENKTAQLQFRGKRIFLAVMEDLMAKGMHVACEAGTYLDSILCFLFQYLLNPKL